MELTSPAKTIIQFTRVQIPPHMMNSDIEDNILIVLQQKVEGKCNKYGFIEKVYNIEEYKENIIMPENFSGSATYSVSYLCTIIIPIENTFIIGNVKNINPELVVVMNGPIIVFIPKANIDSNIWDITNEFIDRKNKNQLKVNDYVKVHLKKVKNNQGDLQIKCIGTLLDRASDNDIKNYYGTKTESNFIM
jgi:DNA-directed RNA polymerase subunit E'/Rpb7